MNREKLAASEDVILKAVIICDDVDFAVGATAALKRVGEREGVNALWAIKYWPANVLNEKTMVKKALRESRDAHLIVFPARHAQEFPIWLRDWLERWVEIRQIKEAGLGVIMAGNSGASATSYAELTRFTLKHGLQFVGEGSSIASGPRKDPDSFSTQNSDLYNSLGEGWQDETNALIAFNDSH